MLQAITGPVGVPEHIHFGPSEAYPAGGAHGSMMLGCSPPRARNDRLTPPAGIAGCRCVDTKRSATGISLSISGCEDD